MAGPAVPGGEPGADGRGYGLAPHQREYTATAAQTCVADCAVNILKRNCNTIETVKPSSLALLYVSYALCVNTEGEVFTWCCADDGLVCWSLRCRCLGPGVKARPSSPNR